MFRKKRTLGEFGMGADQPKTSPKVSAPPTPPASPAPAPVKVEQPLFGVTISPGKTKLRQATPIPTPTVFTAPQPNNKIATLGKVLERYVSALKRELIIDDLMRDFMENTEQFLEEANEYYTSTGLGNFLAKYAKPYKTSLSVCQLTQVLSRLSDLESQHPLDQILVIPEMILAGKKMHLQLANLPDSSANELRAFSEDYQQLTNAEREAVTDKILNSLTLLDADYLSGILAYATTTVMCKRDANFNIIYKTEVASKTETTIEIATTIENNGKRETQYTLESEVTVVTRTTDPETGIVEKFPMRAAAEIANLMNDAEKRRAAILQADRQRDAEKSSQQKDKNTLAANLTLKPTTSMTSIFQQPMTGTIMSRNQYHRNASSPRDNMVQPTQTRQERALSLLNLSNDLATSHHVATRYSSMGNDGV